MIEVWSDGNCWVMASDPALYGPAFVALDDEPAIHSAESYIPSSPIMSQNAGNQFLGRVVIEFWKGINPLVATIGTDEGLIAQHARRRLRQMVSGS
jgi:hypothetical protein